MPSDREYLVKYGTGGMLGRFVADDDQAYQRGDRVLIQSDRGQETGTIVLFGAAGSLALPYLPVPGQLLRRLTSADEKVQEETEAAGRAAFALARLHALQRALPVEFVDLEMIPEPRTIILHTLRYGSVDVQKIAGQLSLELQCQVLLHDMTASDHESCGSCGSCGEGGCGSGDGCGSGGCGSGCSAGSEGQFAQDWQAYFAERRQDMERRRISLPL